MGARHRGGDKGGLVVIGVDAIRGHAGSAIGGGAVDKDGVIAIARIDAVGARACGDAVVAV